MHFYITSILFFLYFYCREKETNQATVAELDALKSNYEDQTVEINKLREKETELLQFNKELTERVVKLQNEISLYNSKVSMDQLNIFYIFF